MEKSANFCKILGMVFSFATFCTGNLYGKAIDLIPCGMSPMFQESYEEDIDLALAIKDSSMISTLLQNLTADLHARCRHPETAERALSLIREHLKKILAPEIRFFTQEIARISHYRPPTEEPQHLSNLKAMYGDSTEMFGQRLYLNWGSRAAAARRASCSSIDNRKPQWMCGIKMIWDGVLLLPQPIF